MILIHYGEIGLKGKNRKMFEDVLVKNIRKILKDEIENIRREYGRVILEEREGVDYKKIKEKLEKMPGIENFSFTIPLPLD